MKILFLGYAVSESENRYLSGKSDAGNKMELGILFHLKEKVETLDAITVYPIAPFPTDKTILVKYKKLNIGSGIYTHRVSFLNVPLVKQLNQMMSVYRMSSRIISKSENTMVITFNLYPQVGVPAVLLKRKFGCKVVPFLADLPIDDNYQRKGINKYIHRLFNWITKVCIRQMEDVIVLNKHARDVYAPNSRFLVVDGGFDPNMYVKNNDNENTKKNKVKNIVYTGSLAEYSGIMNMISAMYLIKNKFIVLDIYGSGNMKKKIEAMCGRNIRYHGMVSQEEVFRIQREAWLLVNPRPIDDEIAKVTFPSKIFEYMVSGTPVLTTRLNGFNDEYEGKLLFAEDNKPTTLAKCIDLIDDMSNEEVAKLTVAAKDFVLNHKTWDKQMNKVCDFLEDKKR